MTSALVTATELKDLLKSPNIKVVDASYNLPPFSKGIAGAQDFNIDDIADPVAPFKHTVPTEEIFAHKVGALGISNNDTVVVYDRSGIAMAAARAWWMFRLFGHDKVKILNGGLPAWANAGLPLAEKPVHLPAPVVFKAQLRPGLLKLQDQMAKNLNKKEFTVIDARDSKRFGDGHIPASFSTPYSGFLNPDGTLKPKDQLEQILKNAHVDTKGKITSTCGSGVTACVLALALYELGREDVAVYDGSWTEWGANLQLPKAQGF